MTVDTGTFAAIIDQLELLEARVADLGELADALVRSKPAGVARRVEAFFDCLERMSDAAGLPLLKPARQHLRFVPPGRGAVGMTALFTRP